MPGRRIGSAFFPRLVGGAAILAGVVRIAVATGGSLPALPGGSGPPGVVSALAVVAAAAPRLVLAGPLGFLATTALVVAALAVALGVRPPPAPALGAGAASRRGRCSGRPRRVSLRSALP